MVTEFRQLHRSVQKAIYLDQLRRVINLTDRIEQMDTRPTDEQWERLLDETQLFIEMDKTYETYIL